MSGQPTAWKVIETETQNRGHFAQAQNHEHLQLIVTELLSTW